MIYNNNLHPCFWHRALITLGISYVISIKVKEASFVIHIKPLLNTSEYLLVRCLVESPKAWWQVARGTSHNERVGIFSPTPDLQGDIWVQSPQWLMISSIMPMYGSLHKTPKVQGSEGLMNTWRRSYIQAQIWKQRKTKNFHQFCLTK